MTDRTVFGLHAVESVLRSDPARVKKILISDFRQKQKRLQAIQDLARHSNIPIEHCDKAGLEQHAPQQRHQGIVAICAAAKFWSEAEFAFLLSNADKPLVLILDQVQDPHNLGACLRTANAVGATAVVIPKTNAVQLTATVSKVASGAAEWTPLISVTNIVRTIEFLKQQGFWIYGLVGDAEQHIYQTSLLAPIALVLGSEGEGIRPLVRKHCDKLLKIPMVGTVESLNVSVASALALYEVFRQKNAADIS